MKKMMKISKKKKISKDCVLTIICSVTFIFRGVRVRIKGKEMSGFWKISRT